MGRELKTVTFESLLQANVLQIGDGYRAKNEELGGNGVMFLRAGHVHDHGIDFQGVERFHTNLAEKVAGKMAKPGDAAITTKGNSTGRVCYIRDDMPPFVYSPHLSYWRSMDRDVLDPRFLYYWSRSNEFQTQLQGMSASTDMAPYLSLGDQRRLRITLPPITDQRRTGTTLGALDDKIDLNRRMNETLEAMARAVFRSWFVDFEPVRAKAEGRKPDGLDAATAKLFPDKFEDSALGPVPKGWRVGCVSDIGETNVWTLSKADHLPHIDYVEISEVSRGQVGAVVRYEQGSEPSRARRRVRNGDTILSTVRPDRGAYFLAINPAESLIVSTGFAVLTPRSPYWSYLHSAVTQEEFGVELGRLADGGAYPAVRPEVIATQPVVIPNEAVEAAFHRATEKLFLLAAENRKQSAMLAAIRDALLPKLLSGEVRVSKAVEASK